MTTDGSFADLAARVLRLAPRLGGVRFVAVDGYAGAGKTTFAGRLADQLRAAGAGVAEVHTDDLLEGWADIVSFWPRLETQVLGPLAAGAPAQYRRYDWHAGAFDPVPVPVAAPDVLLLEGVTAARAAARQRLTLSVFVAAPAELRLRRGIERDGEALRPHWLRWQADEERHFAADGTLDAVDLVVDGAPPRPVAPGRFVALRDGPAGPDRRPSSPAP